MIYILHQKAFLPFLPFNIFCLQNSLRVEAMKIFMACSKSESLGAHRSSMILTNLPSLTSCVTVRSFSELAPCSRIKKIF